MHYKSIRLPDHWSGQQARAVMDFIYQLEDFVWGTYEEKILNRVGDTEPDPTCHPDLDPHCESGLDDDIPF